MATKQVRLKDNTGENILHPETELDLVTGAQEALNAKAAATDLTAHTGNKSNPHSVTKAQVGLGNVENVKQYSVSNPPPYPVTSVAGKTGAVTLAKADVGLDNVDNTSDANKPVSTAQQQAIDDAISYSISSAGTAADNKITTHNEDSTAHNDIREAVQNAQAKADDAYSLAQGRSRAVTFDTVAAMTTALKAASSTEYRVGDNIFIKATDTPDYWISAVLTTNTGTYGYYEISALETQKVDLSEYAKTADIADTYATKDNLIAVAQKANNNANAITKIVNGTTVVKKAQCDGDGNEISSHYAKSSTIIGIENDISAINQTLWGMVTFEEIT